MKIILEIINGHATIARYMNNIGLKYQAIRILYREYRPLCINHAKQFWRRQHLALLY